MYKQKLTGTSKTTDVKASSRICAQSGLVIAAVSNSIHLRLIALYTQCDFQHLSTSIVLSLTC
jgi:hypothetical protein